MDGGARTLATHPFKTVKKQVGDADIPVNIAGIPFVPGQHPYADEDGLIVRTIAPS